MEPEKTPLRKKLVLAGAVILALALMTAVLWQPLAVFRLQSRAGQAIEAALAQYGMDDQGYLACQAALLGGPIESAGLQLAVADLQRAAAMRPKNAHTQLLLGQAHCLIGETWEALAAFERFSQMRPDNPLGDLEAGMAHFNLAVAATDMSEPVREAHARQSRALFEGQGYTFDYFLNEADAAFERGAYPVAWTWYRLASWFEPLPEEAALRAALLDEIYP